MPVKGQPGSLKDRFKPQEKKETKKDPSPVGRLRPKDVKENQPPPKQDSKEEEEDEDSQYKWGRAQSLSGFWSNVKDDAKAKVITMVTVALATAFTTLLWFLATYFDIETLLMY